jgi:predicted RNase H-like HicB family nuclease
MLAEVRRENSVKYYIAVCLPLAAGGWRAFFPDIPGCNVAAPSLDRAVFRAANALADHTVSLNGSAADILPLPRDLSAIKADKAWSATQAVNWSSAVITMIPQRTTRRLEEDHEIAALSQNRE